QSVLELAPVHLPPSTAQHVLSGKYADSKNPRAQLAAMASALEARKANVDRAALHKEGADAERRGDRDRARLVAQLIIAEKQGDRELAARLAEQISSNRKIGRAHV